MQLFSFKLKLKEEFLEGDKGVPRGTRWRQEIILIFCGVYIYNTISDWVSMNPYWWGYLYPLRKVFASLAKVYLWDDEAMLWPTAGGSCIDPSLKGWSLPLIDHGWIYEDEYEDEYMRMNMSMIVTIEENYPSLICWSISHIVNEWRWGCQLQWTLSDFWMISRWIVILLFMICCSKQLTRILAVFAMINNLSQYEAFLLWSNDDRASLRYKLASSTDDNQMPIHCKMNADWIIMFSLLEGNLRIAIWIPISICQFADHIGWKSKAKFSHWYESDDRT